MPIIRLIKKKGDYGWRSLSLQAGQDYEVTNQEAWYLVNEAKVAEFIDKSVPQKKIISPDGRLKIGLIRLGGIGDTIVVTALARALKRKNPESYITIYIRDALAKDVVDNHPDIDRVVLVGNSQTDVYTGIALKQNDLVYDNRYFTKVVSKSKLENGDLFKPYEKFFDKFPYTANELSKSTEENERSMMFRTSGVEGNEEDIVFPLTDKDKRFARLIDRYVTVHNGNDFSRTTKSWVYEYWVALVEMLVKKGYKVVQVGNQFEDSIKGAIDMLGQTSFRETAGLISGADFHIDSESGLVHLAWAVRTRSIVLFSPTPVKFFGYSSNVNIEGDAGCKGCWWSKDNWWRICPRGFSHCRGMREITPIMVIAGVEQIEKMLPLKENRKFNPNDINEKFAMELVLDESHYKAEKHQWERVFKMIDAVKGNKVLEVGAGDGFVVGVLKDKGFDVTATEISEIRLKRMRDKGINAVYADIHKLPFEDASFDTVMCGEVLEHIPSIAGGFKELERVCKPDGKIVISLPIHERYNEIKMHLWGVKQQVIMFNGEPDLMVMELQRIR